MKTPGLISLLCLLFLGCSAKEITEEVNRPSATVGEWRHAGGSHFSDKYSALDQIDASNFANLEIAWRYKSPDLSLPEGSAYATADYRAVPLVIDDTLYVNSNHGQVSAVDPASGQGGSTEHRGHVEDDSFGAKHEEMEFLQEPSQHEGNKGHADNAEVEVGRPEIGVRQIGRTRWPAVGLRQKEKFMGKRQGGVAAR